MTALSLATAAPPAVEWTFVLTLRCDVNVKHYDVVNKALHRTARRPMTVLRRLQAERRRLVVRRPRTRRPNAVHLKAIVCRAAPALTSRRSLGRHDTAALDAFPTTTSSSRGAAV
jgi:hypothetical protein